MPFWERSWSSFSFQRNTLLEVGVFFTLTFVMNHSPFVKKKSLGLFSGPKFHDAIEGRNPLSWMVQKSEPTHQLMYPIFLPGFSSGFWKHHPKKVVVGNGISEPSTARWRSGDLQESRGLVISFQSFGWNDRSCWSCNHFLTNPLLILKIGKIKELIFVKSRFWNNIYNLSMKQHLQLEYEHLYHLQQKPQNFTNSLRALPKKDRYRTLQAPTAPPTAHTSPSSRLATTNSPPSGKPHRKNGPICYFFVAWKRGKQLDQWGVWYHVCVYNYDACMYRYISFKYRCRLYIYNWMNSWN